MVAHFKYTRKLCIQVLINYYEGFEYNVDSVLTFPSNHDPNFCIFFKEGYTIIMYLNKVYTNMWHYSLVECSCWGCRMLNVVEVQLIE